MAEQISDLARRLRCLWRGESASPPRDEEARIREQVAECRGLHATSGYYEVAEPDMHAQWNDLIFPLIRDMDFRRVLELAPGHGRNTRKLMQHASDIQLIDVNESCIQACQRRFGTGSSTCTLGYHVGNGYSLAGIADESVTLVYSWDSVVHFDKRVVRRYIAEFARVLVPRGTGFIHHSNYGALSEENEAWTENPSWRSNVSRELFAEYCAEAGLEIITQQLIPWFIEDLDCLSTFRKPGVA